MLEFRWNAQHAGAPDDPRYQTAVDVLHGADLPGQGVQVLQSLPKIAQGLPDPSDALRAYIDAWVAKRGKGRAVVMVHGFAFNPGIMDDPGNLDDPFNGVYANPTKSGRESWLPIVGETDEQGKTLADIAVAFCWTSIGSMNNYGDACWKNIYQYPVFDLARLAARALAAIILGLHRAGVPVDVFAHSLGTRTALEAVKLVATAEPAAVRRAVLVGGAQFSVDARDAVARATVDVYSFASQSDPVLFWGATQGCHPFRYNNTQPARVIGRDGMMARDHWIDFQLDRGSGSRKAAFEAWFKSQFGAVPNDEPDKRGRHWAYYRQPPNRTILPQFFTRDDLTPAALRRSGAVDGVVRDGGYGGLTDPVPPTPMTCAGRNNPPVSPFGTIEVASDYPSQDALIGA